MPGAWEMRGFEQRVETSSTGEECGMTMRLDEAITTAIEFEKKVLKVYQDAGKHAAEGREAGAAVFAADVPDPAFGESFPYDGCYSL